MYKSNRIKEIIGNNFDRLTCLCAGLMYCVFFFQSPGLFVYLCVFCAVCLLVYLLFCLSVCVSFLLYVFLCLLCCVCVYMCLSVWGCMHVLSEGNKEQNTIMLMFLMVCWLWCFHLIFLSPEAPLPTTFHIVWNFTRKIIFF